MSAAWWYILGGLLAVTGGTAFVAFTIAWAAGRHRPKERRR